MNQLLDYQSYRKENIKNRLVRRAAEIWGFKENEIDSFDPLVAMMLEACAVEFEKIGDELNSTRYRVLDRLAALMNPETDDIMQCAHGIIQTQAIDPFTVIMPAEQFYYRKSVGMGINTDYFTNEIFFSPVLAFKIFNTKIKYWGDNQSISKVEKGNQRSRILTRQNRNKEPEDYKTLWIGLEFNDAIESLTGMNFFFDWLNNPKREIYYDALKRAEWYVNDQKIETEAGLIPEFSEGMSLESEFDALKKMERQIKLYYDKFFITFGRNRELKKHHLEKKKIPEHLSKSFPKENLQSFQSNLLWIEVRFPTDLDAEALQSVYCSTNCLPVMNRKLHTVTYRPKRNLNIIPLESKEPFLAIKSITDDSNSIYKNIPFTTLDRLPSSTYTLRFQGVGRFDGRNAKELLYYVLELLHDESKAFSAMDTGFLSEAIFQLNQNIANLEIKVNATQASSTLQGIIPFVVVNPPTEDDNIYVEFWSSDGEMANRIPAGSHIVPYSDVFLQKDEVYLITTSTGGANRLRETDKINNFKQSLLTRGRIVTQEDIKVACLTMVGDKVREVRISKSFITSHSPQAGVIRCILIELVPASVKDINVEQWDQICAELRVSLESRSASNLPYYIILGN